jgi:DNA-directed RNA polymerase specialized sigma24 family protein
MPRTLPRLSPGPAFFKWSMGPPTTRYDFADVDAYVREHSAHVPAAQLDVYAGYWLTGWSIAALAELDGITPRTVKKRIIRLRHRVRRWVSRQRPQRTR